MKVDKYPIYTLSNIYLDTDDFLLIRRSIEKPLYKEKLRLRTYVTPGPSDNVFLEIKKKYNKLGSKRRVVLPFGELSDYINKGIAPDGIKDTQIFSEIDFSMKKYNVSPKFFIAYDRSAYKNIEGRDLRITFDSNIRYRTDDLDLSHGTYGTQLIDDPGFVLMEIKAADSMPLWLAEALEEYGIKRISFSKYGNCYKKTLGRFEFGG